MSSSNPNPNNPARRGQHSHGNYEYKPQSGLRRSHIYGSNTTSTSTSQTYSRIDGARTGGHSHSNPPRASLSQPTTTTTTGTLPTAGEYFATTNTTTSNTNTAQPQWARSSRFASKQIRSAHANINSSYGLPPTPESDVSVSRVTTPPRPHRDYQFNVDMMQRMTQHAKISPLNHYDHLKRALAEENILVDTTNVDRLVARAGERVAISGTGTGTPAEHHYSGTHGRRVAFRSPEAVEGAREASRRLNGLSGSMYQVASKPAEPMPSSNMYDELKRTLSESSSERPKRIVRQPATTRQLPPLSPVQRRHVEQQQQQQNEYYQQESRPRTAPSQDDAVANIDWLAAAQEVAEESPRKTNSRRRRPRTLSSGTPLATTAWSSRQPDEFGGELKLDSKDTRARLSSIPSSSSQLPEASKPSRPNSQPSTLKQLPSAALSNSYLQHNLVDFVSEDDLTFNLSSENRPPVAFESSLRSTQLKNTASRRPATSSGKLQEASFLQSTKKTDPDETLDTLRQLSRLLSGNTPAKQDLRRMAEPVLSLEAADVKPAAVKKQQQQDTPPKPTVPSTSTTTVKPTPTPRKASGSQTPTSKTIQFDDGYETDDSLDRLLTNDTDYISLLKPATFEDESFLHGTVQVAKQSQPQQKPSDLEALALRTKVLNNLQTVQLDIRETRRGLENIERKFGMLEDDGVFKSTNNADGDTETVISPTKQILAPRRYVFVPRKRKVGKGLFRRPWVFKDYMFAFLFLMLGLLLIEYKLWSDTIIPQYSRVSSDEWFAKHPVGSYRPGGTFRAIFSIFLYFGNLGVLALQQVFAAAVYARDSVSWLQGRVMATMPLPGYQVPLNGGSDLSRATCAPKVTQTSLSP
ncbi:hypothetical protein ABW21_db0207129 [Orbilia brochopaga]|nr:hypothetical protein ABW21_db0207129 [Drechslerella brochopaga]